MRIYISVDMEGISGVTSWEHVLPGNPEYQRFRHIMTDDVNAAIQGASEAGATEFMVRDGHANATNLLIEKLYPRAIASLGLPAVYSMVQDIDRGDFAAAFFIGYHAKMGTANAVLDHTWSSKHIANMTINQQSVGEFGLNLAMCGHYHIPVILISGDLAACQEAKSLIPEIHTVSVKEAISRSAARCLHPDLSQKNIFEAAKISIRQLTEGKSPGVFNFQFPAEVTIEFTNSRMTEYATTMRGSQRINGKTIQFHADNMPDLYRDITTLCRLSGSD